MRLLFILAVSFSAFAAQREDTARLARHLKATRGIMWLPDARYRSIQAEYLDWIDVRMKAGDGAASMNRELKAAGLLQPPDTQQDEILETHPGYLEPISIEPARGAKDILVVAASMYIGVSCALDVTAVLYQLKPLLRLGYLNGSTRESQYSFYLSDLDVGLPSATGEKLVASGWAISNCTSTWNGKRIRIDSLNGASLRNILVRDLSAHDREPVNVAVWVQGEVATFWYDGGLFNTDIMWAPAIARYRIEKDRAVRETPVALTVAGFIAEWLNLPDSDATRWGEPEAVARRQTIGAEVEKHGFEFAGFARCGESRKVWEVGIRVRELEKDYVFRIGGSHATELRMLAIKNGTGFSCTPTNVNASPRNLVAELPW